MTSLRHRTQQGQLQPLIQPLFFRMRSGPSTQVSPGKGLLWEGRESQGRQAGMLYVRESGPSFSHPPPVPLSFHPSICPSLCFWTSSHPLREPILSLLYSQGCFWVFSSL